MKSVVELRQVNPFAELKLQQEKAHPQWIKHSEGLDRKTIAELRELNAKWFSYSMGFEQTAPMLLLINQELTRRGVAPMWRGVPRFVKSALLPETSNVWSGSRGMGDKAKKNVMKRWIDLEWLRVQLGPQHITHYKKWQQAFSDDIEAAVKTFSQINKAYSSGGGKVSTAPAHEIAYQLSVPRIHRLGLTGLIDRDSGERVRNMEKRINKKLRPLLEAQMERATYALSAHEAERRTVYCQAIELAVGSPTDAALLFQWMTGERVTRQSMQEMKVKIATQCRLTTRAWQPKRASNKTVTLTVT